MLGASKAAMGSCEDRNKGKTDTPGMWRVCWGNAQAVDAISPRQDWNEKTQGTRLPESHVYPFTPPHSQDDDGHPDDDGLPDPIFLQLSVCFNLILFSVPILPFGMGMLTLCHRILEVCKLLLSLHRLIAKSLLESQIFKTIGTVKTMGILDVGLNAIYIMRWPWAFGSHGRNVVIWIWNAPCSLVALQGL